MKNSLIVNGFSVLLFRMFLSGIFITAGTSHINHPLQVESRIENAVLSSFATSFGDPYTLGIITGIALLIGGIALLLGILPRWSALGLLLVLIPITITIQMGNGFLHGPFWKNMALLGGLLFFIINNPKVYSIQNLKFLKS